VVYIDFLASVRTLFDAMLGNYGHYATNEHEWSHSGFMIFHIFVSNIFLLNYLIAILSTVYEKMEEQGDFSFRSNKYQYIERYKIAMEDKCGYQELVVHPPPINYLFVLLLPSVFRESVMQRSSKLYSYLIFWLENVAYYIPKMIAWETLLIPFIYLRLVFNILRVEYKLWYKLWIAFVWLFIGPFYLIFGLLKDMYYYLLLLCDYHEHDNDDAEQKAEDKLQDHIVIYNEVIDTIRAIMNIFKYKKAKKLKKRKGPQSIAKPKVHDEFGIKKEDLINKDKVKDPLLKVSNKFDLLEELQR
jgi:hypothetical protein